MRKLSEDVKTDVAIWPRIVSSDGTASYYFKMDNYSRAKFVWCATHSDSAYHSVTAGGTSAQLLMTSTGTLLQATSETGANSATIGTASVSLRTKVTQFAVGLVQTAIAGVTLTVTPYDINGVAKTALTFTGQTATAVASAREFHHATANASTSATNLAALINDSTYGIPDAYAAVLVTGTVTVRSVSGETMFDITSSDTQTVTLGGTRVMGILEVNASQLTLSSNFTHVAINVANEDSAFTSAYIIRSGRRARMPVQMVGAIATAD